MTVGEEEEAAKWVRNSGREGEGRRVLSELSKWRREAGARGTERASDLCSMRIPFDRSVRRSKWLVLVSATTHSSFDLGVVSIRGGVSNYYTHRLEVSRRLI